MISGTFIEIGRLITAIFTRTILSVRMTSISIRLSWPRRRDRRIFKWPPVEKGMHWTVEGKDRNGNLIILDKRKIRVDGDELSSPIIVSIEWDVTELEMMKRELLSSKEKAEMSDSLKSAFLANMSHEIRTPLNAIVGFSHLIAESDDAEERKTYYNIVNANNERLLQLINEILDLSKIESGTIEFSFGPASLHNLCREVYDAHIFRTPQGVSLVYESSDESLMIETDKNRVFQVISNLIGNAVKFTKRRKYQLWL